jgi:ATP-dependent DNA helicase RecG
VLLYARQSSETAARRLTIMKEHADGFRIADLDLQLRGPGEYLGERQSGAPLLRFANLERDADLLSAAQEAAAQMIESDPPAARAHVARWLGSRRELTHA